ncbi:AAA family ATPase [Curtobacterium flaccumfaciens]|uniref:AAA family ATPase n=1 Tax=Curtobacterium flaccumfaciens TaxID=2035 RepID=UPI000FFE990F|nr:SMC family ATPase [Curtobacterium flaccumfaciens]MCS0645407.1 SMC family ATPase [Curtobacterium flaccumfaciens pv. flaccumfaciens]MCS6527421.1 SMC family ATPase [Curtobacterium flaccumfaciens pv. flaccumfaciens]MCS6530891.1 SMC family ATPase [Curtobacterium flaccumfaciens pv. flaccumfaciens]NUU09367.1 SMC family ATPase [Curtobacterium flaccumfaciens]RXF83057.1 SMC family ATPase [Curtobacterium flaccumfaciens pv. flaccumfaciens]
MYLHRLELRAIGPYPDLVTIDFAALAASGVFLLEGPTGSGKSTIIDAVVFALYGGLAGSDASSDRLHSQHADPAVEPFVELVFETGAGTYRVRRTPQYDRPKQRGTGTVKQQASVQLFRLAAPTDVAGEPMSSRIPEVGVEIARIVGLDRAQFLQTVVLPQGEFARFLRSPGEDRRKLLQSLFGTQVYDRTADELAARRRAVQAEVEGADDRVREALARFAQAADLADADESVVPGTVASLRATADAAGAARTAAAAAATAATEHERSVTARAAALERRAALLRRQALLDDDAPAIEQARAAVATAERAARVAAVADGLDAATVRADDTAAAAARLREQHALGAVDAQQVARRRDSLTDALSDVRHLVAVEAEADTRRTAIAGATATASRLTDDLAALDTALEARPTERARIVEAARTASTTAAGADAAAHEVTRVQSLRADLAARDRAEQRVAGAERIVADARRRATEALDAERSLRERRIAGLAGELGAALTPGDPCPVCGSTAHPSVAAPQDDHPTIQAVESAGDATRTADQQLADAAADLAVERAEHLRLTDVVGTVDTVALDAMAVAADERVRAAHDAAALVLEHERERTAHDTATRALERERNDLDARRTVLASTAASDAERLEADLRSVHEAIVRLAALLDSDDGSSPVSFRAVVDELDGRLTVLRAVAEADDRAAAAARARDERSAEVARVLDEQGFPDVDAARAGLLDPDTVAHFRSSISAAEAERAVVRAGLDDPAVVQAADDDPEQLDVPAAQAERVRGTAELDEATRLAVTAAHRAEAVERCATEVDRTVRARQETSARSRAVVRLADVANGVASVNPTGITLGTYVLMRRFEDVVAAANDRLRGMLAGRFTLETSDERESGSRARRTGLALAVHDHTTDTVRDPRSLSGGETFTVSLCLALGLADVVQAEAGGVSLGTLFVDEGFGTLDPETLDDVIGQLSRLTAGGRQVGIVSHVEELKQRIPERIAVRRTPAGGSQVTTTV